MKKKEYNETVDAVTTCLDYIFDTENEDFHDNPSKNHIYYIALVAAYDSKYARNKLNETKKDKRVLDTMQKIKYNKKGRK